MEIGEAQRKRVGHCEPYWVICEDGQKGFAMRDGDLDHQQANSTITLWEHGCETLHRFPPSCMWHNICPTACRSWVLVVKRIRFGWRGCYFIGTRKRGSAVLDLKGQIELIIIVCFLKLQERDIELELGDDYILDLQSKGLHLLVILKCQFCEKCERALMSTNFPTF